MKKIVKVVMLAILASLCLVSLASCKKNTTTEGLDENGLYSKITLSTNVPVDTLTPTNGNSNPKTSFYYNLYESLFDFNENQELCPDLGKEINIVDDTHWQITIFKDIYDSESNHITASDVAYSMNWLVTSGNAVNYDCFSSISAKSDYVVEIVWKTKPASVADIEFPLARTFIFSEKAWGNHKFASDPIATGNYVVKKFVANSSLTITVNENYWADKSTEEGIENRLALHNAMVKEVVFNYVSEASSADIELGLGNIDYCDYIKATDIAKYQSDSAYTVDTSIGSTYSWMGFNMDPSSVFYNNLNLRLAVCYALDSSQIASVQPGNYTAMKTYGTGYFSDFNTAWENETNYSTTQDLTKAKEYLQKSGYKNEEIVIMCKSSEEDTTAVEKMLAQLKAAGFNVKMSAVDTTTFQTDTADYSLWDLVVFSGMGGSSLVGSWQLALSNVGSTCSDGSTASTLCFNQDTTLFEKYAAANNASTKNDTTVKAVIDYVYENAYIYPLTYAITAKVYKADKISSLYYREGYVTLAASTFKGQTENKNNDYKGWTLPTDGTYDPALAGTYTYSEAGSFGSKDNDFKLILAADGTYRLECNNCVGENIHTTGTWIVNSDGKVVCSKPDNGVEGDMDKFLNSGWADADEPAPSFTLNADGTMTPVGVEPADPDPEPADDPIIVTYLTTNDGYTAFNWDGGDFGKWYLVFKSSETVDGVEKGDAKVVVTGLSDDFIVYHGSYTNDKGTFTFTLDTTNTENPKEVTGDIWEKDNVTIIFGFVDSAFQPLTLPDTTPIIVTYLTTNDGYTAFNWDGGDFGKWYFVFKSSETVDGIEKGDAKVVVTGLSDNFIVYHGTYTNDKGTFTFTLDTTNAENPEKVSGELWEKDQVTIIFGFGSDGFAPKTLPIATPIVVTYLTTNDGYTAFTWKGYEEGTWYFVFKSKETVDGVENGDALLVVTGLSENFIVYHGTYTNDKGTFTFTLDTTNAENPAEVTGNVWSEDKVTAIFGFGASGFAPKA